MTSLEKRKDESEGGGRLIMYECRFSLHIDQLQAQMYFPSSFQVQWRTLNNQQLAKTKGFNIKSQQHKVRYDEQLTSSLVMVYDRESQQFIQKDTLVVVNYYLNNKQQEVKQLGRLVVGMGGNKLSMEMNRLRRQKKQEKQVEQQNRLLISSENVLKCNIRGNNTNNNNKYFKSSSQTMGQQQVKYMKLQGSMYNAKLRYKCELMECKQSKLSIQQINLQQFNNPSLIKEQLLKNCLQLSKVSKNQSSSGKNMDEEGMKKNKQQQQLGQIKKQKKQTKLLLRKRPCVKTSHHLKHREDNNQNNQNDQNDEQQQQRTINHDDSTSISRIKKYQTLTISSTEQNLSTDLNLNNTDHLYEQQIIKVRQLQMELDKVKQENVELKRLVSNKGNQLNQLIQKQTIELRQKNQQISRLESKILQLQQDIAEKEVYFLANLQKLQQMDQLRYDFIETREYANKLQQRLVTKYKQKPQTIKSIFKTIQSGTHQSQHSSKNNTLMEMLNYQRRNSNNNSQYSQTNRFSVGNDQVVNENNNNNNSNIIVSSLTILDDNLVNIERGTGMRLSLCGREKNNGVNMSSANNIRHSMRHQTKGTTTVAENLLLYSVANSEIQLTNSQKRMIEESTVKMQHELSFMQMQLYEVKAEVNFQQEKYQKECILHQQTKMELYEVQQQLRQLKKQLQELQNEHIHAMEIVQQLHEENENLNQEIKEWRKREGELTGELFKLKQSKQEQQYELNIIIKEQKIYQQSLLAKINKLTGEWKEVMEILQKRNQQINKLGENNLQMKRQLILLTQENNKSKLMIEQFIRKQRKVNEYLVNLEKEIQQVHKIVSEKELNQDNFTDTINQKQKEISRLEHQLVSQQLRIKNYQLEIQNYQAEMELLYQQKQNTHSNNTDHERSQHQSKQKCNTNKVLLEKNKQLLNILNKNMNTIVQYEKQKKQFTALSNQLIRLKEHNRELQEVKAINTTLKQQNQRIKAQITILEKQLSTRINNNNNPSLQQLQQSLPTIQILQQQRKSYIHLTQQHLALTQQLLHHQSTILTQKQSLNEIQNKLNKIMREKKLLQESIKILQGKSRNYLSMIVKYQSTVKNNQTVIKQLQARIKHMQNTYDNKELNNNNDCSGNKQRYDKISSFALHDLAASEIKLESHIEDSNNTSSALIINVNSNHNSDNKNDNRPILLKQNSLPERFNFSEMKNRTTTNLSKEIQQLRNQLKTYQALGDINSLLDKQRQQQHTRVLMKMIQQYINAKKDNTDAENSELKQLLSRRLSKQRFPQLQQQTNYLNLSFNKKEFLKKSREILNSLTKYKNKVLKNNRTTSQLALQTAIQPLKSIENGIKQIMQIVQFMVEGLNQ